MSGENEILPGEATQNVRTQSGMPPGKVALSHFLVTSDLDLLFAALRAMRENMDDKVANEAADREFHLAIARATGNEVLRLVVTAMWDNSRADPLWKKIEEHFHTPALRAASQEDHQCIFSAIVARDASAARSAMQAHLARVIVEFTKAWR